MPSTGTPSENTSGGASWPFASYTDSGPPDRMMALGAKRSICSASDIAGVDLRIHAEFAHAARDQLGVLGTEIENEDPVRVNIGHQPIR